MVGLFLVLFFLRKLHTDLHDDIVLGLSMKYDWMIDREKQ